MRADMQPEAGRGQGNPLLWPLLVGSALIFLTFMRFSLPELAWIVFVPFLVVLQREGTLARHGAVLGTLIVSLVATVSKIVTAEIPWAPAPAYALPMAASYFMALSAAAWVHRSLGPRWGAYVFAATVTALGWAQYTFTPSASWGVLAHTQLDNLPLVQLAALTGVGGISFLVALGSGLIAASWTAGLRHMRLDLVIFGILIGAALVSGQLRLDHAAPGKLLRVGGIVSPVTHREFRAAYDNIDSARRYDDELFARSARAADLGARVVVWNEVATVVTRASEPALAERGRAFALTRGVGLLMAYGVFDTARPTRTSRYVNKYRFYAPDGSLLDEYLKRHPVPVDPSPAGQAHARVVLVDGVALSGGICYDYSFPEIARDNANDGAQLALVPSSDWHGIDPEHGRMALMNAVAVGLPMVRPVRAATSIASDQYGRLLASLRADAAGDGVMIASVPTTRLRTIYSRTGELLPPLALVFSLGVIAAALAKRRVKASFAK